MTNSVNYKCIGNTGHIVIDNPPVNATSLHVRAGLLECLKNAEKDNCIYGVISCSGSTFVAGGDISEFGNPPASPHLPDVYSHVEASAIIWVAAMHGSVLGGGLELALACDYRIALKDTKFGLPEVNLGLVPGAGGTQRLPRLVGVELATEMICGGKPISAERFLHAGGIDLIIEDDLLENARKFVQKSDLKRTAVSSRSMPNVAEGFFELEKTKIENRSKGFNAPLFSLSLIQSVTEIEFSKGQILERQRHLQLRDSEQSRAMRYVFFGERAVAKPALIRDVKSDEIEEVAIVGGGLMGSGIAASCLGAGMKVDLIERDEVAAHSSAGRIETILRGGLKRNKISRSGFDRQLANLRCGSEFGLAANADLAIEAVFEDVAVKQTIFSKLAKTMRDDAIIATNTSYLDPGIIGSGIKNTGRLVGLHFFSPAHLMKLVEIIRSDQTSRQTIATAFSFTKRLGKTGILCGVCDGFVGNRMLSAYRRQADYFLADGATPKQVDNAMQAFGMPMGPYELQDMTGLQIAWANRQRQKAGRDPMERYVTIADQLCEAGRMGQSTKKGWYRYEAGTRSPVEDDDVLDLIEEYSRAQNIIRTRFDDQTISSSLIAVLANEGAKIVEEGIVESELEVDMVKIYGYGFPRWRGGPMYFANIVGDEEIRKLLKNICQQSPNSWVLAKRYS